MYNTKTLVSRFTDYFYKQSDGKLYKLMSVIADELQFAKDTIDTVRLYRAIDHAEGVPLDVLGAQVNQLRGHLDDVTYRRLIKAKIIQNRSHGTLTDVVDVTATVLATDKRNVVIVEGYEKGADAPSIELLKAPLSDLATTEITARDFLTIVRKSVAAGVQLKRIELDGTLEISQISAEQDSSVGLSDLNGTIGGMFDDVEIGSVYIGFDLDNGLSDINMTHGGSLGTVITDREDLV